MRHRHAFFGKRQQWDWVPILLRWFGVEVSSTRWIRRFSDGSSATCLGLRGIPDAIFTLSVLHPAKVGAMGGDTSGPYTEGFDSSVMAAVE